MRRFCVGKESITIWEYGYLLRIVVAYLASLFVYFIPNDGGDHLYVYIIAFLLEATHVAATEIMRCPMMAFFTHISDPRYGGSYMTLFNTINNFAGTFFVSPSLYLVDILSQKDCVAYRVSSYSELLEITHSFILVRQELLTINVLPIRALVISFMIVIICSVLLLSSLVSFIIFV